MPNPYIGNDDAARFVDYYASSRMERDSVRRLYNDGIQRRKESLRQAEENAYPPHTPTYRSQREIDEYINRLVYEESFRRRQKLAELEWVFYQPPPTPLLSSKQIASHVERMHDNQMRNKNRREQEMRRRLCIHNEGSSNYRKEEKLRQREINHGLEEGWRPPSAYVKYDDGAQLLISELAAIHKETPRASSVASRQRPVDHNRLFQLSKPLRVTPKVTKEEDLLIPPFRLVGDVVPPRLGKMR